jgi:hypothetical protein
LAEVRQSARLGPKVAGWLEQNAGKLTGHPMLQAGNKGGGGMGHEAPPPPPPPPRGRSPEREPERDRPAGMPKKVSGNQPALLT